MKKQTHPLFIAANNGALAVIILAVGILSGGTFLAPYFNGNAQAAPAADHLDATVKPVGQYDMIAVYERAFIDVYQDTLPSVVKINAVQKIVIPENYHDFEADPHSNPHQENPHEGISHHEGDYHDGLEFFEEASGTGFVWDFRGHIVTNYHVAGEAVEIEVVFADDTVVKGDLVGGDPDSDLAVIKVDLPGRTMRPVKLGDSSKLQVGQLSIAIGNPFGQEFTMTSGIISAVGRTMQGLNDGFSIPEVIQTDAPINPGNSGGPLLNRQGEVIGVNSQNISQGGGSSGIGFAVPINIVKRVVPKLINGESYQYSWLGISGSDVTGEMAEYRKIEPKGAMVLSVVENGPAAKAGLLGPDDTLDFDDEAFYFGGEIITAIDDQPVNDMDDLITYLVKETEPGDEVTLDVIQLDGKRTKVEITLGVRPVSGTD